MIRNTFSIFPGIGERLERHIWKNRIFTWPDFLKKGSVPGFSETRKSSLDECVHAAIGALDPLDASYFGPLLKSSGAWRLWDMLADEAVCLDIETDGRPVEDGAVTVAGFYSHGEYRPYVFGHNLTEAALQEEFDNARLLVTYFGTGFDVPFLKARFPALRIDAAHFDLCPAGHRVGLKGGLKNVEREVGIQRDGGVEGMTGYEAVLLWKAHASGTEGALDTLVKYNKEDTVNLHELARIIYERLRDSTGLPAIMNSR